jgi:tetratricopeptide (TPR) repeat protein
MKPPRRLRIAATCLAFAALPGCSELRGRSHAREGNRLFLEGDYAGAAREYEIAEELVPALVPVLLNKGLACRQLMTPGTKNTANDRWVTCALDAFKRMNEVAPNDPRGDQLYVQTLFDAERYPALVERYQRELRENPKNLAAINGLVQVYTRWDHWDDALKLMIQRAEVASQDAEAQYAVGVFIWNRLFQKGGGADKATFDPRDPKAFPPPFGDSDIVGEARVQPTRSSI